MTKPASLIKRLRCAIYTRKSSDEGLDQAFNSLHAQREACEAYVTSQAGEGWSALPAAFDDGGFSGGSMDRPGLKKLLDDIRLGRVDIVVVYKVDRLTRSLSDFAKIVDAFDAKGVSFVSVTQSFNTTSSMGRLTLNMLLSFAQFEREVTGERIRDKIAASKAKGMWMGGRLPLGYDAPPNKSARHLVVNPKEAETVRLVFGKYLETRSVHELARWLDAEGIRSKGWTTRSGLPAGGGVIGRGALFHLLRNRTYLGEIIHGDRSYPGAHPAIVDRAVFDEAQALLTSQDRRSNGVPGRVAPMLLKGLIFDADGAVMTPTHTHSKGRIHRYYVSGQLTRGARAKLEDDVVRRVPAGPTERLVKDVLAQLSGEGEPDFSRHLLRVEILPRSVELVARRASFFKRPGDATSHLARLRERLTEPGRIALDPSDDDLVRIVIDCRMGFARGSVHITRPDGRAMRNRPAPDEALIAALKTAHGLLAGDDEDQVGRPEMVTLQAAPADPYDRARLRLAFLAPDLQAAILAGLQSAGLTRQRLVFGDIPLAWEDQRRLFAAN